MKVKFLQGFRGRETNEMYYEAGQVVDIEPLDLIERGIVEIVLPEPVKAVITKRATVSPTKKGKK